MLVLIANTVLHVDTQVGVIWQLLLSVAWKAFANVIAWSISTMAIAANAWIGTTFIDVFAFAIVQLLVAGWTRAHKRADKVLAHIRTLVDFQCAFVDIDTVVSVWCELIVLRANAFIRAGHILTTECTLMGSVQTLVDIFANFVLTWLEADITVTTEAPKRIGTSSVATWIVIRTLINVITSSAIKCDRVAWHALTSIRSVCIDAHAVFA
jgi:hypothetical protein